MPCQYGSLILDLANPFDSDRPSAPVKSFVLNPTCTIEFNYALMLPTQMSTGMSWFCMYHMQPFDPSLRFTTFGQFT